MSPAPRASSFALRARCGACILATSLVVSCTRATSAVDAARRPQPPPAAVSAAPAENAAPAPVRGVTHEELLRRHADAGPDAPPDEIAATGHAIAPDGAFADEQPVAIVRARYAITLPDERAALPTERALRVDDQGDRASAQLVGTGLPIVPGMRVAARAGLTGFALVSPDGRRYRAITPDDLQRWFLGNASRPGSTVAFRRTDEAIVATRGGLSLVLATERTGEPHPLTCRILVALFLGGDPAAARVGCGSARLPTRATLRARGWPAVVLERTERAVTQTVRAMLAVPPADATADLPLPARAPDGAFFAPSELAALGGTRRPENILTLTNNLTREALVFVDDLAIGWVAPGRTATFVGLSEGRHAVRARALDGLERSHTTTTSFPASVTVVNAPMLQ